MLAWDDAYDGVSMACFKGQRVVWGGLVLWSDRCLRGMTRATVSRWSASRGAIVAGERIVGGGLVSYADRCSRGMLLATVS